MAMSEPDVRDDPSVADLEQFEQSRTALLGVAPVLETANMVTELEALLRIVDAIEDVCADWRRDVLAVVTQRYADRIRQQGEE